MSLYVCIDIGGTSIKHGVANEQGRLTVTGAIANSIAVKGLEAFLQSLLNIVQEYQSKYMVEGVAICTAGIVNTKTGCIVRAPHYFPGYAGVKLSAFIKENTGLPAIVINDVNAVCLGEYWQGAGQKAHSLFCLTFGTGIGGAFMLEGKLWEGVSYCAGEVGLMHAGENANWEDLASTAGLIRNVGMAKGIAPQNINGRQVFAWAQAGDTEAINCINKMVNRWAVGIANICYVVNPQVVILGGGVMAQFDYLLPRLKKELASILLQNIYRSTSFVRAQMGNGAGMVGALYYFLQEKHVSA